jgi:hypothetical protein
MEAFDNPQTYSVGDAMTFRSKIPWPSQPENLPTYEGNRPGRNEVRKAEMEAGGMDGTRRVDWTDAQGVEYVLNTRNGMPTVSAKVPVVAAVEPPEEQIRTFVFSIFGSTLATIANKQGSGLFAQVINKVVAAASYIVNSLRTDTVLNKWKDVVRMDGSKLYIDASETVPIVTASISADHDRSSLPYVDVTSGSYLTSCVGDSTRSVLFFSKEGQNVTKVVSVATDGSQKSEVAAANRNYWFAKSSAGTRIKQQYGEFWFYFAFVHYDSYNVKVRHSWSRILAEKGSPYLSQLGFYSLDYEVKHDPLVVADYGINYTNTNTNVAENYTGVPGIIVHVLGPKISGIYCSDFVNWTIRWHEVWDIRDGAPIGPLTAASYSKTGLSRTRTGGGTTNGSIVGYGYVGSEIQLSLNATLVSSWSYNTRDVTMAVTSGGTNTIGGMDKIAVSASNTVASVLLSCANSDIGNLSSVVVTTTTSADEDYSDRPVGVVGSQSGYGSVFDRYSNEYDEASYNAKKATLEAVGYGQGIVYEKYNPVPTRSTNPLICNFNINAVIETKDYLFADLDEKVFLYLHMRITSDQDEVWKTGSTPTDIPYPSATRYWVAGANVKDSTDTACRMVIEYVLEFRGSTYKFPLYDDTSFTPPKIELRQIHSTSFGSVASLGAAAFGAHSCVYHPSYKPLPVFNPPFMNQGNCPYLSHTTLAEEAAGAEREIYIDFPVSIRGDSGGEQTSFSGTKYDGVVPYLPYQLTKAFRRYIMGEDYTDKVSFPPWPVSQNAGLWTYIFPATPYRIQFCNGAIGPWANKLPSSFSGNPQLDLSRI